ncbi:MAG: CpaD family pilus assembly protein [Alphaproteobacteria bacterium]|nr:CpaD family pilus assembly protein [Alphaproteobacteria bacterium]
MFQILKGFPAFRVRTGKKFWFTFYGPLLFVLSACGSENNQIIAVNPFMSVEQRHPIRVLEGVKYFEVPVPHGEKGMTLMQKSQFSSFIADYKNGSESELTVRVPIKPKSENAVRRVVKDIRELIMFAALPSHRIKYITYKGKQGRAVFSVFVTYPGIQALPENKCGIWGNSFSYNKENTPYYNLGCATQNNLALMLDDPMDMKQPRIMEPPLADRSGTIGKAFVAGKNTASSKKVEGGRISEVGQ